jgi:predicted MFS family arabinose efflux permease
MAGGIASLMGWRAAYLVFAIPPLVLAALLYLSRNAETPLNPRANVAARGERVSPKLLILPLVLLFSAQVTNSLIYRGVVTFLPSYLGQRINVTFFNMDSVLIASSFTTFALIFGVGGQFLAGHLCERVRHEKLALLVFLTAPPLLLAVGNSHGVTLIIAASVFAFFHFMTQPVFNSLVADYSPPDVRGAIFGAYFFVNFGFGSFAATIQGAVADHMGLGWVFIVSAGIGLIGVGLLTPLLVRALKRR